MPSFLTLSGGVPALADPQLLEGATNRRHAPRVHRRFLRIGRQISERAVRGVQSFRPHTPPNTTDGRAEVAVRRRRRARKSRPLRPWSLSRMLNYLLWRTV